MFEPIYNGEIVAGSLLVSESRKIADLLMKGVGEREIYGMVIGANMLQKRSPASAKRQARLILNRLTSLDERLWSVIRDGSQEQASQALFCAAIKHSRLLGDFLSKVVRNHVRTFQRHLSFREWDSFFEECSHIDPGISTWSETTRKKVRQVIFRMLAEAKVIDSAKSRQLIPFVPFPEIKEILVTTNEEYTLRCLEALDDY